VGVRELGWAWWRKTKQHGRDEIEVDAGEKERVTERV